jgi:hypothetical protein
MTAALAVAQFARPREPTRVSGSGGNTSTEDALNEAAVESEMEPAETPSPAPPATPQSVPVIEPPSVSNPRTDFVYALGQLDARYPSLSIEKEVAQAIRTTDSAG